MGPPATTRGHPEPSAYTRPMPWSSLEIVLLAMCAVLAALLLWQALRGTRADGATEEVVRKIEQALDARQPFWARDIQVATTAAADRVLDVSGQRAEQLRSVLDARLAAFRDTLTQVQLSNQQLVAAQREAVAGSLAEHREAVLAALSRSRAELLEKSLAALAEQGRTQTDTLQDSVRTLSRQLTDTIESLTRTVDTRLEQIQGRVNERLDEGFRKTNETFASVMARLATIDEAQRKIDGLTTNVVSLQELLGDKRSRGAFGEVQLENLVRNLLPPSAYDFQWTLSNGHRADCVLRLPEPTGLVAVDAKFPLENYHRMSDPTLAEADRRDAQRAFKADVRRHVDDIAARYVVPGETSDGAVMFVPAEAVFAEIHGSHPEVVDHAMGRHVWIVSPTTMMAVLNTARAVLKDVETRRQVHVIKDELAKLGKDFGRFDERMRKLATHIRQAHEDADSVQVSSEKIVRRFRQIERVDLDAETPQGLEAADLDLLPPDPRRADG